MRPRVLTALILIPVVLGIMMSASLIPLACLAGVLLGITYQELYCLGGGKHTRWPVVPALVGAALAGYFLRFPSWIPLAQTLALTLVGVLVAGPWVTKRRPLLLETASLWLVAPVAALLALHYLYRPGSGLWYFNTPLLLVLVPLWVGDTLAYLVGKRFGRRLLAPALSPKKTVEGALANFIGSIAGALAVGSLIGAPWWVSGASGALTGALGQAGDLFESGLKRKAGVKDSGAILPGHGGLLDRVDSLLFSAPACALFIALAWPPHR